VAAAHSLRVLLVVVLIPVAMQAAGVHGADATLPVVQDVRPAGLAVLLAAAAAGMALLWCLGTPNPWVLGALASTLLITASGGELSALPQVGHQRGAAVHRRLPGHPVHARLRARRTALDGHRGAGHAGHDRGQRGLRLAAGAAAGLHPATVLLGTSPGGIAEMCITAKVLQLGVPVVTAFHVVRYVAVLTLTGPLYRWELGAATGLKPPRPSGRFTAAPGRGRSRAG
jgi:uncharacterized membrane protein AbrB (regulator of aidB expression)